MFAGPGQYPPTKFLAYGIVAFPARATPDSSERFKIICNAYQSNLLFYTDVGVPTSDQMVTVWPIEKDPDATSLNNMDRDKMCQGAVDKYGLKTSLQAIADARAAGAALQGRGPFLLAWSPAILKGRQDALVLTLDLSMVANTDQADRLFQEWKSDIIENPELWNRGWRLERIKNLVALRADKFGSDLLKVFGGKT
jgi:hypothetical protein